MSYDPCAVCGFSEYTEECHVLPKKICKKRGIEDMDYRNTLDLCPNHHKIFDELDNMVLCPEGSHAILKTKDEINVKDLHRTKMIKTNYNEYRYKNNNITGIKSEEDVIQYCGCE